MSVIVSDAEVIGVLGKLGEGLSVSDQATLLTFRPGVINAIKHHIGYDPEFVEGRVEYLPNSDVRIPDNYLLLTHLPVRSIDTINIDLEGRYGQKDSSFSGANLRAGDDYAIEYDTSSQFSLSGHVIRYGGYWPSEPGSIKITYDSGYLEDEFRGNSSTMLDASGVKSAALLTLKKIFGTIGGSRLMTGVDAPGPISGERAGDYSYTVNQNIVQQLSGQKIQLSPEAIQYLEPFVSYNRFAS